jgi:hypothetical protein
MKFEKMPFAEPRERDGKAMLDALHRLTELGADVRRPKGNGHQLKVSPDLSYYPTTGRIVRDSEDALDETGLGPLIDLLRREGWITQMT